MVKIGRISFKPKRIGRKISKDLKRAGTIGRKAARVYHKINEQVIQPGADILGVVPGPVGRAAQAIGAGANFVDDGIRTARTVGAGAVKSVNMASRAFNKSADLDGQIDAVHSGAKGVKVAFGGVPQVINARASYALRDV